MPGQSFRNSRSVFFQESSRVSCRIVIFQVKLRSELKSCRRRGAARKESFVILCSSCRLRNDAELQLARQRVTESKSPANLRTHRRDYVKLWLLSSCSLLSQSLPLPPAHRYLCSPPTPRIFAHSSATNVCAFVLVRKCQLPRANVGVHEHSRVHVRACYSRR